MSDTKTQLEELEQAAAEKRQPYCVRCDQPLVVCQEQDVTLTWTWDERAHRYTGSEERGNGYIPRCEVCGYEDWGLLDDGQPHTDLGLSW